MGTLVYFIKEAVRGFYQAKLMTSVSILSITVSLCLMNGLAAFFFTIEKIIQKGTDQADIAAYIYSRYEKPDSLESLIQLITSFKEIDHVHLITKDSAWNRFKEVYGSEMLESVDGNPLPASIEVFLDRTIRSHETIKECSIKLQELREIESVSYSDEWISLIEKFMKIFWIVVIVLGVIINLILYFMISNTIKLTIYARKELVEHMQVVGATPFFIKIPFIIEGILQGVVGGCICLFIMILTRMVLITLSISWGPQLYLFLITIFLGVLYGWLGSMGAIKKFLV